MVSEETKNLVFNVVDANQEYNAKLFVLILIFFYMVFMWWYSYRIVPAGTRIGDIDFSELIRGISLRYSSSIIILLYPLFSIFLFRGYSFSEMTGLLWGFYSIVFVFVMIYGFVFGWEKVADMFNLNVFKTRGNRRMPTRK